MMWTTHATVGLFLYILLAKLGIFPMSNLGLAVVFLGSIIPDIDHPKSFISHLSIFTKVGSKVISLGGHRGPTHTIWATLLSFPFALILFRWLGIGGFVLAGIFTLGYLSHLLADSLTVSGVAWFSPFDKYKIKGPVRTGSVFEILIFLLLSIVILQSSGIVLKL